MQENAAPNGPVVDADGFVVCPECGTRVDCGTGGLANLDQHLGKKRCQNAKRKHDKERKTKNTSIFAFLKPKPKPVPSTVQHSEPIHSQKLPKTTSPIVPMPSAASSTPKAPILMPISLPEPSSSFVVKLQHILGLNGTISAMKKVSWSWICTGKARGRQKTTWMLTVKKKLIHTTPLLQHARSVTPLRIPRVTMR